jgi:hypothetical protein
MTVLRVRVCRVYGIYTQTRARSLECVLAATPATALTLFCRRGLAGTGTLHAPTQGHAGRRTGRLMWAVASGTCNY